MIDIRTALAHALLKLDKVNPNSRLEAEILLAHVLGRNRAYLFAYPERTVTPKELDVFEEFIAQRALGVPIAYITGTREFWSLPLKVNRSTLIPRHETERLVELALELIPDTPDTSVLELGTGSGAIALAIAKERPQWHIDACDFNSDALEVAKGNANVLGITNICFYHSDWYKDIPMKLYQAIVSNPPYIDKNDPHLQEGDVRFEPPYALVSSADGLADLQYIVEHGVDYLSPDGIMLLEHGFDQKRQVNAILNGLSYRNIQCWQDLLGHDRVSSGWRPNPLVE